MRVLIRISEGPSGIQLDRCLTAAALKNMPRDVAITRLANGVVTDILRAWERREAHRG